MMRNQNEPFPYILGLDIGASSIGWAVLRLDKGKPAAIQDAGVRIFKAGVEGVLESGRDEPRSVKRRMARQQRRMTDRRSRRLTKVFHLLQRWALLPPYPEDSKDTEAENRHNLITKLDAQLLPEIKSLPVSEQVPAPEQVFTYILRASALDSSLTPYAIGRALYHLAQRRGFLSNRLAPQKKDEDLGTVKEGIVSLMDEMRATSSRTLAEYLVRIDPDIKRIRERWTGRDMYVEEFNLIWNKQAEFRPVILTEERKQELLKAIFYQRPLKSSAHLIGRCEFERGRRRAPLACMAAQDFRLLQKLNDLKIILPNGNIRLLTESERQEVFIELERNEKVKFDRMRKLLGLSREYSFNLQQGDQKHLLGNVTKCRMMEVFGQRWLEFSDNEQNRIIGELQGISDPILLRKRGMEAWGLDSETADSYAKTRIEEGYLGLSRKALAKLLPLMQEGVSYATAVKEIYGERKSAVLDKLPPVLRAVAIRNPAVTRSLTELRKVVNALIREYGKPQKVNIELARELRKSRLERERLTKENRQNEKKRTELKEKILQEAGLSAPSGRDIEKALLWDECAGICPYTGKSISFASLFGDNPQFDVEHIIPYSRCLDDSFANKTLCHAEENRSRKRNHTPLEAYGHDESRWEEILERVKQFKSSSAYQKLRRFQTSGTVDELIEEFSSRQLNDTRYASRLAGDYLSLLYGGRSDEDGNLRIRTATGQVTAMLRDAWELNSILGDGGRKSRSDHRHHAIDAIAVSFASAGLIKELSYTALRFPYLGQRALRNYPAPWPDFAARVMDTEGKITISHRSDRRLSGQLHKESLYSPPRRYQRDNPRPLTRIRKRLDQLTVSEIPQIADDRVRELVLGKLEQLDGNPKKFSIPENLPYFLTSDGRHIPIKSVRIDIPDAVRSIGRGSSERFVLPGNNHHMEVFARLDKSGNEIKWTGNVVSLLEATERAHHKEQIVRRTNANNEQFKFSLCCGDIVSMQQTENAQDGHFVIRMISHEANGSVRVGLVPFEDARKLQDKKNPADYRRYVIDKLRVMKCRKVSVDPLGRITEAND
jgi:CRISPR-associated endonuclease Csn1